MTLTLTEDEFIEFLKSPKFVEKPLKYQQKNNASYQMAQTLVRCPDFPELNLRMISQYHISRNPRKFSILLLANNERIFAIDVNPGTCLLYTSPSPRDRQKSRMPSSA